MLLTDPQNVLGTMGMLLVNVSTALLTFYLVFWCVIPEAYTTLMEKYAAVTGCELGDDKEEPPGGITT